MMGAPGATIRNERLNSYPVQVTVWGIGGDGKRVKLWQNAQRNLFSKYWDKRERSQKEITAAVGAFAKTH